MRNKLKINDIVIFAILAFGLIWANKILKSVSSFFGQDNSEATSKQQDEHLAKAKSEINESYLSHKKSEYYAMADAIEVALQAGWTENEMSVWKTLRQLWNNSDYLMLKLAWGKRPIGIYGFRTLLTLEAAIRFYFSENQINTCNHILKTQKGGYITYRI